MALDDDFGRFCVYVYLDPRPGRALAPIYVGKGITKDRPERHWRRGSHNRLLNRTLEKIRELGLKPSIRHVGYFQSDKAAFFLEKNLIKRIGRKNLRTGTLCNLTDGGEGSSNPGEETRAKLAEALRKRPRRPINDEERIKMSLRQKEAWLKSEKLQSQRGAKLPIEHRAKLSESHLGNKPTEETKAKMSKTHQQRYQDNPDLKAHQSQRLMGRPVLPETRQKIGERSGASRRGMKLSQEHKTSLSVAHLKFYQDPEKKAQFLEQHHKPSFGMLGKKHSAETKAKMSEVHKRRHQLELSDE